MKPKEKIGEKRIMREIKFRAWDKKYNTMLDPEDISVSSKYRKWLGIIDNLNIMQYTGFKDLFIKDIYEGDVVAIYFNNDKNKCKVKVIEYNKGMFYTENYLNTNYHSLEKHKKDLIIDNIMIVGNIYEDPTMFEANINHKLNWDKIFEHQLKKLEGVNKSG